jgi:hypothetical protein
VLVDTSGFKVIRRREHINDQMALELLALEPSALVRRALKRRGSEL